MSAYLEPRYLLPESIANIGRFVQARPWIGSAALLGIYFAVLEIMHWRFGRVRSDMMLFALIVSVILIVVGSACFTYTHVPGFRFGG